MLGGLELVAGTGGAGVRVLLSSTGGAGHFGPLRPFIAALARRGVELLIVVPPQLEATVSADRA